MVYLALEPPLKCSKTKKLTSKTLNDDFARDFLSNHDVAIETIDFQSNLSKVLIRLGFEPIFEF